MMNSWYGQSVGLGLGAIVGLGIIAALIAIIIIVLKGYALWNAARRGEKWWFIVLLIINTVGILELIYLYFVVGKWHNSSGSVGTTSSASGNTTNTSNASVSSTNSTPTV